MGEFKSNAYAALRQRPLPLYRRLWVKLRIGFALLRLRLFGAPEVSDEAFERAARKYRSDKSLP